MKVFRLVQLVRPDPAKLRQVLHNLVSVSPLEDKVLVDLKVDLLGHSILQKLSVLGVEEALLVVDFVLVDCTSNLLLIN